MNVVNAVFLWTEPHSKRIKVKVTIQKEVQGNSLLETTVVIEFVIKNFQCADCKRQWTPHTWNSVVQLRQKIDHKRTIMYVEQLILKNNMHTKTTNVKEMPDGIDFFFDNKTHAIALGDFIHSQMVSKYKQSKQLISADKSSNEYCYTHTFNIELAPICREDLIHIPPKLRKDLGGAAPLCLVLRMASMVQLLDVSKLKVYTIDEACYWTYEPVAVSTKKQLTEFIVLNITPIPSSEKSPDYVFAEVEVQRSSDFGENEKRFYVKTHLGGVLKIGDPALGYDIDNLASGKLDFVRKGMPDVVLVKKVYPRKVGNKKKRAWKIKHMEKEKEEGKRSAKRQEDKEERDYEGFLEEIEEDPEMRAKINIYNVSETV